MPMPERKGRSKGGEGALRRTVGVGFGDGLLCRGGTLSAKGRAVYRAIVELFFSKRNEGRAVAPMARRQARGEDISKK